MAQVRVCWFWKNRCLALKISRNFWKGTPHLWEKQFRNCLTFGPRHFRDRKEIAKFYKKLNFMLSRDIFLLQRFLDDNQYKQSIWVPRNNAKYILLSFKFCIYFAWHQGQWGSKPGGVVKLRNATARELLNSIIHYHFGQTLNGESLKEIGRPPSFTSAWFSQTMTLNYRKDFKNDL